MSDDLRNRVARAIAYSGDIREKREWSELLPETRSHYRKQADAALAEMGGVRVKPLEWEEPCASNNHIYMARAPWGTYGIHIDGGRHRAWLEAYEKPYERWLGDDDVGSLYEAQRVAEDDNRARILAAIEPAPSVRDEGSEMKLAYDAYRKGQRDALDGIRVADPRVILSRVRAISEGEER